MNKQLCVLPVRAKRFFSTGVLILLLLAGGCSTKDPLVDESEKDPLTPSSYTVAINDGKAKMPPGGGLITAEFSDFAAGEHVGKLVDSDATTQFSTPHQKFYILWDCRMAAVVNRYAVTSGLRSAANDPKAWILSASNDKQAWTQLDSRSNQSFAGRAEEKLIPLENETLYKYYRLEIISNGGGASTEMAEWSLERYSVEVEDSVSDLPYGGGIITPQYAFFSNGCGVNMLADSDPETVYETPYSSFYLLWQGHETQLVNYYSLTAGGGGAGSSPVAWTLYGSTNNDNWITLDEQEGQQFAEGGETKEYPLENETEYKYYKLQVRANGGAASTQIAEWGMMDNRSVYLLYADTLMSKLVDLYLTGQYDVWNSSYPNATGPYWDGAAAVWGQGAAYSAFVAMMEASSGDPNLSTKYAKLEDRLLTSLDKFRNTHNGTRSEAYGTYLGPTDERYYDDNEWIGIDMTNMYLLTGKEKYLERAQMVWKFIMEGYDDKMGGGIYWKEGVTSKHTCSTAPAAVMAAKLYLATKDETYLEAAKDLYDWCKRLLQDPADYLYWDNVRLTNPDDPASAIIIAKEKYSYNSGQPMQAASLLYRLTGDAQYLEDAKKIAESAYLKWFMEYDSPVLNERFRILSPTSGDEVWFHAVMFRGFAELYREFPDQPQYVAAFGKSLTNAWLSGARNLRNNLLSGDFRGTKQENQWPLIQEAACAEMLARMAITEKEKIKN